MSTVDFLPFATGSGANVITQSAWAALAAETAGFSTGVAQSNQANKAWRQSSFMCAALANVLSSSGNAGAGVDFIDDGVMANLEASIITGLRSQAWNKIPYPTGGTANALTGTLSPAPPNLAALDYAFLLFHVQASNTAAVTLNLNGLGAVPIVDSAGNALAAGALIGGTTAMVVYVNGSSIFVLLSQNATTAYLPYVNTQISNETTRAEAAETSLSTAISNEGLVRASADTALQGNITSESAARASVDITLQNNINTEATSRNNADVSLQNQITTLIAASTLSLSAPNGTASIYLDGSTFIINWGLATLGPAPSQVVPLLTAFPTICLWATCNFGSIPPSSGACGASPGPDNSHIYVGSTASGSHDIYWVAFGH